MDATNGTGAHGRGAGNRTAQRSSTALFQDSTSARLARVRAGFSADEWRIIETWYPLSEPPPAWAEATLELLHRYYTAVIREARRASEVVVNLDALTEGDREFLDLLRSVDPQAYRLYRGDWQGRGYKSQSEADYGLLARLRHYGCDSDRLQRIFRASGLFREKTDSKRGKGTYLTRSIEGILASERRPS